MRKNGVQTTLLKMKMILFIVCSVLSGFKVYCYAEYILHIYTMERKLRAQHWRKKVNISQVTRKSCCSSEMCRPYNGKVSSEISDQWAPVALAPDPMKCSLLTHVNGDNFVSLARTRAVASAAPQKAPCSALPIRSVPWLLIMWRFLPFHTFRVTVCAFLRIGKTYYRSSLAMENERKNKNGRYAHAHLIAWKEKSGVRYNGVQCSFPVLVYSYARPEWQMAFIKQFKWNHYNLISWINKSM